MSDLMLGLSANATRFQEHRGSGLKAEVRASADEAIERLIAWSASHPIDLQSRGPEGTDPAFGTVTSSNIASVWRVYPRRADGGKVTLLSKAEHYLLPDERQSIVVCLERMQPGTTIGPTQRLEIGLSRLANETHWQAYVPLLELAARVAARGRAYP